MKALYMTWANSAVHCDWVMGPCVAQFNTYAPDPFLAGQREGGSDISLGQNPTNFWRTPSGTEPVIVLRAPRQVMEGLRCHGFHAGHTRDQETGIDVGLKEIFEDTTLELPERNARLRRWISIIQWEVISMMEPAVCTVWHPDVDAGMVRPLVKGNVVEIVANTVEEALAQLPADIHIRKPISPGATKFPVVLLRASRAVMEILREEGWHSGYSRDEVTGQDNGVRRLFASTTDKASLRASLRDIVHALQEEVQEMESGVVTLWHDQITPDMLKGKGLQVIEVVAANAHQAKRKLKEMTDGEGT
jgi:hypothetical protein